MIRKPERYVFFRAALVTFVLTATACGSAPTRPADSATGPSQQAAPLGQLIAAALRASQVDRNPSEALEFADRAQQQDPNLPELAWLAARLCADVPRCQPSKYETRLRKLDPGNAAMWMGSLSRALNERDGAAQQKVLEALSRAERFNVYWNALLWRATIAVREQSNEPVPEAFNGPLTKAMNDVAAWLSAVAMPSFAPLADACDAERTREDLAVAERCTRIAGVLQQGDTFAAEAVGIGIAQRAASPNSASRVALAERAAILSYQHETARSVMSAQLEREKLTGELIELMKKLPREQDVSLAVLRWGKQPLRPEA